MSVTDELLAQHRAATPRLRQGRPAAAAGARRSPSSPAWTRGSNPRRVLGLEEGDAHVIRNAGGVVTDDEIRSLAISQRLLGTEEIILIHHTDCGMLTFTDEQFREQIQAGHRASSREWAAECFDDLEGDVRESIARIRRARSSRNKESIRGFVYDVETAAWTRSSTSSASPCCAAPRRCRRSSASAGAVPLRAPRRRPRGSGAAARPGSRSSGRRTGCGAGSSAARPGGARAALLASTISSTAATVRSCSSAIGAEEPLGSSSSARARGTRAATSRLDFASVISRLSTSERKNGSSR